MRSLSPLSPSSGAHSFMWWGLTLALGGLMGSTGFLPQASLATKPTQPQPSDVDLQVGIVQRFGTQPTDRLTLEATKGDRLTLKFQTGDKLTTLQTNQVKLEIGMQPLPSPQLDERVVFSTHRSFESAEERADQWQAKGLAVELAQPKRWQVWAKREVYSTPLLRRLLLQSLEAQGIQGVHLETQVKTQVPRVAWVVNGYRYSRDRLEITAGNRLIQVATDLADDRTKRLYAGSLRLQPNAYGTYTLVNQVPLETYLRGVVPHEIGIGAPPTAIEAQAILARTYALRNLRRFAIDDYQLCADTQCQVYWGLNGAVPVTDQAIAATRGQVLTYNNELVDALYSSTTGGITAPFHHVWQGPDRPYLRAVVDSVSNVWDLSRQSLDNEQNFRAFIGRRQGFNEVGWDMFRWRVESSLPSMTKQLQDYLKSVNSSQAGFKTIQQVQVSVRSPSGRVQKLAVTTDQGTVFLEKDEIINAFEAPNSLLFYLDPIYQPASTKQKTKVLKGYAFVGGGLGHGVGLSQTGSYNLGRLGWSSQRILNFYFPGTQLQPISQSLVFWRNPSQ